MDANGRFSYIFLYAPPTRRIPMHFAQMDPDDADLWLTMAHYLELNPQSIPKLSETLKAAGINKSKSTLWNLIYKLEADERGQRCPELKVFDTETRMLTVRGQRYQDIARRIVSQRPQYRTADGSADKNAINVATHNMFSRFLFPTILEKLRAEFPDKKIDVRLKEMLDHDPFEKVRAGTIELVVDCPPFLPTLDNVEFIPCKKVLHRVVVLPPDTTLAGSDESRVTYETLRKKPLCYVMNSDLQGVLPLSTENCVMVDTIAALDEYVHRGWWGISLNWPVLLKSFEPARIRWLEATSLTRRVNTPLYAFVAYKQIPLPRTEVLALADLAKAELEALNPLPPPRDIVDQWPEQEKFAESGTAGL